MVQLNSFTGGMTGTCKHCCIFLWKKYLHIFKCNPMHKNSFHFIFMVNGTDHTIYATLNKKKCMHADHFNRFSSVPFWFPVSSLWAHTQIIIFILRTKWPQKSPNKPVGVHLHDCLQKKRSWYFKAQTALPYYIVIYWFHNILYKFPLFWRRAELIA